MREDGLLTALPGGRDRDTGRLRVTAFVTPRVDIAGDPAPVAISGCPSFSDWGLLSGQIALELAYRTGGASGIVALQPDPASPRPDAQLWRTLFADVNVGSGQFQDLSGQTVASFPSAAIAELIRYTYAAVAEQSPTGFPPATSGPLLGLKQIGDRFRENPKPPFARTSPPPGSPAGTPGRYIDRSKLGPPTSVAGGYQTLVEAIRYYDRPGAADPLGPNVIPPPPRPPDPDFHALVAALADYPELLRHLGLALDFLLAEDIPPEGQIRFEPVELPVEWARAEIARPWTAYQVFDRRFIARPRNDEDELVDGSLRVEADWLFHVEQIDLDEPRSRFPIPRRSSPPPHRSCPNRLEARARRRR